MATRDIDTLVEALTLEEKVLLLSGVDMWHVPSISRLGIGSIKVMIFDLRSLQQPPSSTPD